MNISTESNSDSTMTVKAHSITEEYITECIKLQKNQRKDFLAIMLSYWLSYIDVKDAIAWFAMQVKYYYDINWQSQFFAVRDEVLLQLHCEYKLSEIMNWKLKWQFIRLFRVTEWIKCFAYCLNLPLIWKIHNIISIAHLKSASSNNLYNWPRLIHFSLIMIDSADDHYKIEQLLWI